MKKLISIELTSEEWIDVIIALDNLSQTKLFDKRNEKEYKEIKNIKEIVREQLSLELNTK